MRPNSWSANRGISEESKNIRTENDGHSRSLQGLHQRSFSAEFDAEAGVYTNRSSEVGTGRTTSIDCMAELQSVRASLQEQDSQDGGRNEKIPRATSPYESCGLSGVPKVPRINEKYASTYKLETYKKNAMIIFNHKDFLSGKKSREGTMEDEATLKATFEMFNFEVKSHLDLPKKPLLQELKTFCSKDFSEYGCVCVAILTHGSDRGFLNASDTRFSEHDIIECFDVQKNSTLFGKPIIILIQACRGDEPGKVCSPESPTTERYVESDSDGNYELPTRSDMLIFHSSYVGYASFRDVRSGSWFIQTLCDEIKLLAATEDFESICREVRLKVALNKKETVNLKNGENVEAKQMPVATSTLLRRLYLPTYEDADDKMKKYLSGLLVHIKDKNLHEGCFKCSTCSTPLKNPSYYSLNLYCDIHAKLVASQNPPAPNLEPFTVPPVSSTPLPPLTTKNYSNGSSSLISSSSNLSEPKSFGSSIGLAYSPSLSPCSAPRLPARPVSAPAAPAHAPSNPAPAYTPVYTPFAPTNEMPNHHIPHKPEFKSAAGERLVTKRAKMALNGCEIGVQRKVKPADHTQSTADKNQDRTKTVITKHPLNTDNLSSGDSSRESTLRRPVKNTLERAYKPDNSIQSIRDKLKDTPLINHSAASSNFTNRNAPVSPMNFGDKLSDYSNKSNGNPPPRPPMCTVEKLNDTSIKNNSTPMKNSNASVPPPIPNSPIPTFNIRTSSTGQLLDVVDSKSPIYCASTGKKFTGKTQFSKGKKINRTKSLNSSDRDKVENNYLNTLPKKNHERSSFHNSLIKQTTYKSEQHLNSWNRNILGKKSSFEKDTATNNKKGYSKNSGKDKINNILTIPDSNTLKKANYFEKLSNEKTKNQFRNSFEKDTVTNDTNVCSENSGKDTLKKANLFEKISNEKTNYQFHDDQSPKTDVHLRNNSLYTLKPVKANGTNNVTPRNWNITNKVEIEEKKTDLRSNVEKQNDNDSDVVVKRRQKRNEGRRDSYIIPLPKSTMTSADVVDGLSPVCHKCEKATRGASITALGRIWCLEHFICVKETCRRPLQGIRVVEENGQLYCEFCFEQYIAPACDKCHAKIKDNYLKSFGKNFHPECFNCVCCGKLLGKNPFILEDGLPYCESDWKELFATKCFACGFPVEAGDWMIEALDNIYHSHCFNCTVCKKNLEGQSFIAKAGRPFCETHAR